MLLLGNVHVRCSAFLTKTKLASRISCIYVVNRYIIFLLSYRGALGVDYFLCKRSANIAEITCVFFQNG